MPKKGIPKITYQNQAFFAVGFIRNQGIDKHLRSSHNVSKDMTVPGISYEFLVHLER